MRKSLAIAAIMLATGARAFDATPLMSFFQPAASSSVFPISSLVAHYLFNESNATTTVTDEKATYAGTAQRNTSLMSAAGRINKSFLFDGSSDYVTLSDTGATAYTNYSVCVWIKLGSGVSYTVVISKRSGTFPYEIFIEDTSTGGKASFQIFDGTYYPTPNTTNSVRDGNWHHIVGVRNVVDDTVSSYKDGVLQQSLTDTTTGNVNSSAASRIGARADNAGNKFPGNIDDVRIYNRALTQAEITELYNSGNGTEQE